MNQSNAASLQNAPRAKPAPKSASNDSLQRHHATSGLYAPTVPEVITPPENFALVESGLFRSSLPDIGNFSFIRTLNLKHVIILSAERPVRSVAALFEKHNIQVSHTGLHAWTSESSWKPISEEVVKQSMEIILHRDNHPMLVCDVGGMHLVGMVIGCLRRLQNWNINSVINEYRSFAGVKTRYVNEQFIELFDIDLVTIPDQQPLWFVEQMELDRKEAEEYSQLIKDGRVDSSGTLQEANKAPRYITYYYSSASPLNSQVGGKTPRIQTL